jgi:WD40 repeat protein
VIVRRADEPTAVDLDADQWGVADLTFSADGASLAAITYGGTAYAWGLTEGGLRAKLDITREREWSPREGEAAFEQGFPAMQVMFLPDGRRLAVASGAPVVEIHDLGSATTPLLLEGHDRAARHVALSPDKKLLLTGSNDGTVHIRDVLTGATRIVIRTDAGAVRRLVVAPKGDLVATISEDGIGRLWDTSSGRLVHRVRHGEGPMLDLAFARGARRVASAGADGTVRVWDVGIDTEVATLAAARDTAQGSAIGNWAAVEAIIGGVQAAVAVAFSPRAELLATAIGEDVAIFDAEGLQLLERIDVGFRVRQVLFAARADVLAAAGDGGHVRRWNFDSEFPSPAKLLRALGVEPPAKKEIEVADGDLRSASASTTTTPILPQARWSWSSVAGGPQMRLVRGDPSEHPLVALNSAVARLALGAKDGSVTVYDLSNRSAPVTWKDADGLWALAFAPDGTALLSTPSRGGAPLRIREVSTGRVLRTLATGPTNRARFDIAGTRILTIGADVVGAWDVGSGMPVSGLGACSQPLALSADGALVACADGQTGSRVADVMRVANGEVVTRTGDHDGHIWLSDFAPDGSILLTVGYAIGDSPGMAFVWDTERGTRLAALRHDDPMVFVAISPDGIHALTLAVDGGVRIWEARTGRLVASLRDGSRLRQAAFDEIGGAAALVGRDGVVEVWSAVSAP